MSSIELLKEHKEMQTQKIKEVKAWTYNVLAKHIHWLACHPGVVVALVIGVFALAVALILRPPRYQMSGGNGYNVLDTHTGVIYRGGVPQLSKRNIELQQSQKSAVLKSQKGNTGTFAHPNNCVPLTFADRSR